MAVLNSWQRIDRVLPGMVWGSGASGSTTISADPNTRATIAGTATQTTGTAGSTAFANEDLVLLHQTRGTNAGQWEINRILSGGGTTSLTFQTALNYSYTTGAQIIKIPQYTTATVNAHSVTGWDGSTGGVEVICARTSITVSGNITADYLGFRAYATTATDAGGWDGVNGEGTGGAGNIVTKNANGNGAGGGDGDNATGGDGPDRGAGGGGGGNGAAGTAGQNGNGTTGGTAGGTSGSSDLTNITFGGAGGQPGMDKTNDTNGGLNSRGGYGGAIVILLSKTITLNASVLARGESTSQGYNGRSGGRGGGAGGSVLVVCDTASLGSGSIVATGGAGTTGWQTAGGNGGTGRVAVHYATSVTGTTSPTYTGVSDPTLIEKLGGSFIFNLI